MKITDLQVKTIESIPRRPYTNALGTQLASKRRISILEVTTDEGITGILTSGMMDGLMRGILLDYLKPRVLGEDPRNPERLWHQLFGHGGGWRMAISKGEVIRAISALDCALWDILGKAAGLPVYQLIGGYREEVDCYASGGHYVSLNSQREELKHLEEEMTAYMEMGFQAVKVRVGRNLKEDLERVRQVREIIGSECKLLIDFNTSPSYHGGVTHALKYVRALEACDPYWYEDPLIMDDLDGMRRLTASVDTAIATGECEQSIWGFRELIHRRACDIVLPDATQMCGGVTQWRKIAALAESAYIPVAAHLGDRVHLHCLAGIPNGLIVEVFTPWDDQQWAHEKNPVFRPNPDGRLSVSQTPGFGLEIDWDYIEKNRIE